MKTIEHAAEEHANECVHNPNPNDYPDVSSLDIWEYIKDSFKAGVEFAQKWIPMDDDAKIRSDWEQKWQKYAQDNKDEQ